MTITLSSKGGGGVLKQESVVYADIPAGVSGDVLTIPVPEGKLIKLYCLMSRDAGQIPDMELSIGGNIYASGALASNNANCTPGTFGVCATMSDDSLAASAAGYSPEIIAEETIVLTVTSGTTANAIRYAYEIVRT